MTKIYDQHNAAFSDVSAYVILQDGECVGSVAFKYPRDGAGRLWCYFHIFGTEMVRGYASGGGYDKRSAACESAVEKIAEPTGAEWAKYAERVGAIKAALAGNEGHSWERRIEDAGFDVRQAV